VLAHAYRETPEDQRGPWADVTLEILQHFDGEQILALADPKGVTGRLHLMGALELAHAREWPGDRMLRLTVRQRLPWNRSAKGLWKSDALLPELGRVRAARRWELARWAVSSGKDAWLSGRLWVGSNTRESPLDNHCHPTNTQS
jgi:hypothetical protein